MKYILYHDKCIRCRNNNKKNEFIVVEHQRGSPETFDLDGEKIVVLCKNMQLEKFLDKQYEEFSSYDTSKIDEQFSREEIYERLKHYAEVYL
jgi:predicted nucleic-acid-binding Zn-ribbon protein